jgi:hypothetical protein
MATNLSNPTPAYTVHVQRLDPALADLRIEFANLPADVEVGGRLMGPRCAGVSTIEVAYPLRRLAPGAYQVLIPEPSFWTVDRPYVYEGPASFYREGVKVGTLHLSISLKKGGGFELPPAKAANEER